MIHIVLCDTDLNSIKSVLKSIADSKKIKIQIIASEIGELCSSSLSFKNSYFLINTDVFSEKTTFDFLNYSKNDVVFYNSQNLKKVITSKNLEKIFSDKQVEDYSRRFYLYFKKRLTSLKFNFSLPGTYYFLDLLDLFYNNFTSDISSIKYIIPYISLKRNIYASQLFWAIVIAIEDMYFKNELFDELASFLKVCDYDSMNNVEFQNAFLDIIKFVEPKYFDPDTI